MRFSDNGSTWTNWMYPTATKAHKLPKSDLGNQTVRVQYLDGANNYSPVYNDYIKLVAPAAGTEETVTLPGSVPLVMKWVAAGTFTMGSPDTEVVRYADEGPQHSVTLGGFWMGKYQTTKRQWTAVMSTTPWTNYTHVSADLDSPAVGVSWDDIQSFITELNTLTGKTFRLPSESQSEYAARAGTTTRFWWGNDPNYTIIDANAWYNSDCVNEQYAHVVGLKLPNAWGFYDMCGNVMEYCQDYYHDSYAGAPTDGSAWESPAGYFRVLHGGCFAGDCSYARSAHRSKDVDGHYFYGFRLVK
jgi:formylglycine-generating enzyme required for sulfatase activity